MGGRPRPSPPGGRPGQSRIFSFGSLGSTPSPTTSVSASAGLATAAARPSPMAVRRSIPFLLFCWGEDHTLFLLRARRNVRAMIKRALLLLVLLASPATAQEGPVYGPRLEGF